MTAPTSGEPPRRETEGRPFLGVHFRCCNIYLRIYRNRDDSAYEGRCPRCARRVHIPIGEGGTGERFFEAY